MLISTGSRHGVQKIFIPVYPERYYRYEVPQVLVGQVADKLDYLRFLEIA